MVRPTLALYILFMLLFCSLQSNAKGPNNTKLNNSEIKAMKSDCVAGTTQVYLNINQVRASLKNSGNIWFEEEEIGSYIVSHGPGTGSVSSIYAGALWMGGIDPAGNLKVAAVSYGGNDGNRTDYYPGPIDPATGLTDSSTCINWDRFFSVKKSDILAFETIYQQSVNDNNQIDKSDIHSDILYWPAKDNPHFYEKYQFELPSTGQGLAQFWDEDMDGIYDPLKGDFPIINLSHCNFSNRAEYLHRLPDEISFWVYNDSGGAHVESFSTPIQMEVHATAFAYKTNDILNDASFYQYKMINRAPQDILDMYFGLWVDFDLGCSEDDFIGCSPERGLSFAYNQDAADGDSGTDCSTYSGNTYGTEIPIVAVDILSGVTTWDDSDPPSPVNIKMSSFSAMDRQGSILTGDPSHASEYYNYLRGKWRNGSTMYDNNNNETKYLYPGIPADTTQWSMCNSPEGVLGDPRTLQSIGSFLLTPGSINEMLFDVIWLPNQTHPCPSLTDLFVADHKIGQMFDNCFDEFFGGPDAPDVDILELNEQLILNLTNDTLSSNNAYLRFSENDPLAPKSYNGKYIFEGYKVYQLKNAEVSYSELLDTNKAKLVTVTDRKNGVGHIYNWSQVDVPGHDDPIWVPELQVEAPDQGLRHSIVFSKDLFSNETSELTNGKDYHFMVIAYAHNEWKLFNPNANIPELSGQSKPYLEGRANVKVYTASPKANYMSPNNFNYGDGICIDRLSGVGHNGHFIDLKDDQHKKILNGEFNGRLSYKEMHAPVDVKIIDPSKVIKGTYNIVIEGEHNQVGSICAFEPGAQWLLYRDNELIARSDLSIDQLNEQIIDGYGLSVTVYRSGDAGKTQDENNGAIDVVYNYENHNDPFWYNAITDDGYGIPFVEELPFFSPLFNFLKTDESELDYDLDPDQSFSKIGSGQFYPFFLSSAAPVTPMDNFPYYLTPAWNQQGYIRNNNGLYNLNNVDIVFTNDKSKWSRCIVVETNNQFFFNNGYNPVGDSTTDNFDLRQSPSVDQNGNEDGDGVGMSWFPGYAIDVESGKRLNIFFGENSYYNQNYANESDVWADLGIGADMLFNPNDQLLAFDSIQGYGSPRTLYAGAQHFIYLTSQEYDACASIKNKITESSSPANLIGKREVLLNVTWCSMPLFDESKMLSLEDGYIPNDLTVKLRVNNPFNLENEFNFTPNQCNPIEDFPEYEFVIKGTSSVSKISDDINQLLIYPNPVSNLLTIEDQGCLLGESLYIFDANGQLVNKFIITGNCQTNIDVTDLFPGLYIVQLEQSERIVSKRFIKH